MKIIKIIIVTLLFAIVQYGNANNLTISNVTKVDGNNITFDVSWDNSWNVSGYEDDVWLFIKYRDNTGRWKHLDITSFTSGDFYVFGGATTKGIMMSAPIGTTGTVSGSVSITFNGSTLGLFPDFKVFGIEMVQVNSGNYYLGDGNSNARFYQGNDNTLPYQVTSNGSITFGTTSSDINGGGLTEDIPATFPNGYDTFFMMKYEITQEQYVEFLNTLTADQQKWRIETSIYSITSANRFVMTATSSPSTRNGVACDANVGFTSPINFYCDLNNNGIPNEIDDGQNIACNALSIADMLAYLDWAGLRPSTSLEFEKASRGIPYPLAGEYANGSTFLTEAGSLTNAGQSNESVSNIGVNNLVNMYSATSPNAPVRVGSFATTTSNRIQSGGSFYGIMNMQGNITETTINAITTSFTYQLGDGNLDTDGFDDIWFSTLNNNNFTNKGTNYNSTSGFPISDNTTVSIFKTNRDVLIPNMIRGVWQQ